MLFANTAGSSACVYVRVTITRTGRIMQLLAGKREA